MFRCGRSSSRRASDREPTAVDLQGLDAAIRAAEK